MTFSSLYSFLVTMMGPPPLSAPSGPPMLQPLVQGYHCAVMFILCRFKLYACDESACKVRRRTLEGSLYHKVNVSEALGPSEKLAVVELKPQQVRCANMIDVFNCVPSINICVNRPR